MSLKPGSKVPKHEKSISKQSRGGNKKTNTLAQFTINPAFAGAFILLVTLLTYIPAISSGFIWDDALLLTENRWIKSSNGLSIFWLKPNLTEYLPVTFTTFWLEWRLWGAHATGYHVTSILLHASGAILFWRVLQYLKVPGAWLSALVFAVHPVTVESVAWIAERKNTLSLVLYLLSLLFYLRFDKQEHQHTRWYWLSFVTALLALLSKTSVVMLPVILLLCIWWLRRQITREDLLRSLPFFAASLVFGMLTIYQQWKSPHDGSMILADPFLMRILGAGWAIWFYVYKFILPLNLCIVYPRWEIDPHAWTTYLPGILWLLVIYACWRYRHTWGQACLFALGCFTVSLLPVSGVVPMVFLYYSRVADHFQYLAILGMMPFFVGGFTFLLQSGRARPLSYPLAACTILLLFFLTWKQAAGYKDEEVLWANTLRMNPQAWVAHDQLADALTKKNRHHEAIQHYNAALKIKPHHAVTHNNLGNVLSIIGRTDEAITHFEQAIEYNPKLLPAHNNLGFQLVLRKQYAAAQKHFEEVLNMDSNSAAAHFGMGHTLFFQTNLSQALIHYEATVRLQPDWAEARYNAGLVAGMIGDRSNALRHLKAAIKIKPDYLEASKELAELEKQ